VARSGVGLLDEQSKRLHIHAFAGDVPQHVADSFSIDTSMPATRRCLESGQIVFEEDISRPKLPINTAITSMFRAGSVILIPLQVEGRSIGLMALSDDRPRRFSPAQRRLAQLLGSQAAVILANNRLYERIRQSLGEQKQLRLQQEKLHAITAASYEASTLQEALRAVTDRGPEALGVGMCAINLIEGAEDVVVAATGSDAALVRGQRFALAGTCTEELPRNRRTIVIESIADDRRPRPAFLHEPKLGSLIHIPLLRSDGGPIGTLTLGRTSSGRFSPEHIRTCETFATRAAAAIENAILHEQTRRDAQAKATLLAELHHRVKNNLAGIVGLLSMNEPRLPPAARQWLDRIVDRVRTLAAAHDLFQAEVQHVTLDRLVQQVICSLSVIKPPTIDVKLHAAGPQVRLGTSQAINLAMVLHELCSNAVLHALDGRGAVVIRSRQNQDGVAIDVWSDPQPSVDKAPPDWSAVQPDGHECSSPDVAGDGVGLRLVRELVTRELQGRFHLRTGPGGVVATIEFPVGECEGAPV